MACLVLSVAPASGSFDSHDPLSLGGSIKQTNKTLAFMTSYTARIKFTIPCSVTSSGVLVLHGKNGQSQNSHDYS